MADEPGAPTEPDAVAELTAWIEQHPHLQGEGGAIDVALRLLDHAYDPDGTDEPSLLSAHTPTLRQVVPGGKSRSVTYTAMVPVSIEVTQQWRDDVPVAEIEGDVQRRVGEIVTQLQQLVSHAHDPASMPAPSMDATVRFGRPTQTGIALLEADK